MGTQTVTSISDKKQRQHFIKALLNDIRSLEYMLDQDWFEKGITRFGSELEMVLVDKSTLKPCNIATAVLDKMKKHKWLETELAQFNLEINCTPRELTGKNFTLMENEIHSRLQMLDKTLSKMNAGYVLTGILPTIQKFHLNHENLTPRKRYFALLDAIKQLNQNKDFELKIFGIDELFVRHDSPLLEAANTSWQIHLQVAPSEYVKMYNIAQTLAGPCISLSANSPIVFGKRLWHESRIAMFEQALDTRNTHEHMREQSTRVSFGKEWLQDSILDIYREDISRFKVILSSIFDKDSWQEVKKGKVPDLDSLLIHNSTVYRWNRPQYGISDNGQPHLRIENRVMPAGPTIPDQMANAVSYKISSADINKYLGILNERVKKKTNGATWILDSYADLRKNKSISQDETLSVLTHSIMKNQKTNVPVHKWKKASLVDLVEYKPLELKVSEFMQTDLFTVEKDDVLELVGEILDWKKVRYLPVEDSNGNLKGLITSRVLTRHLLSVRDNLKDGIGTVADIMIEKPITIKPEAGIMEAMKVMRKNKIGGLPVVKNKVLVGFITETDFLDITSSLLERLHTKSGVKKTTRKKKK